jgi:hypothetical protein
MRACSLAFAVVFLAGMCSAEAGDLVNPRFDPGQFHHPLKIDNWLWAMWPERRIVYGEIEDQRCVANDFVVTHKVKKDFRGIYRWIVTRAVSDNAWADDDCDGGHDRLVERTTDWYAQDDAGNIWYLGEDTTEYFYDRAGHRIGSSKEGSWQAGRNGAAAGLVMLAHPKVGQHYRQEYLRGVAEDRAEVVALGREVRIGIGRFSHCVVTREWSPLSPGDVEFKFYCPNVGLVQVRQADGSGGAEALDLGLH